MNTSPVPVTIITVEDTDMPDTIEQNALERAMLASGNCLEQSGHVFSAHPRWNLANREIKARVNTVECFEHCIRDAISSKTDLLCLIDLDLGDVLNQEFQAFFADHQLGNVARANPRDRAGLAFAFQVLQGFDSVDATFVFIVFCSVTLTEYTILEELRGHTAWSSWSHRISCARSFPRQCNETSESVSANLQSAITEFLEAKGYGRGAREKIIEEFEGWFPTSGTSGAHTPLPHNYCHATETQKEAFRCKLSKIFRVSPSFIDSIIADSNDSRASNIWDSLKGLAGVTAKHSPYLNATGGTGITLGGALILIAAHCPEAERWLINELFESAPGNPFLSGTADVGNEKDLWIKLNAFLRTAIPRKGFSRESNVKRVLRSSSELKIELDNKRFSGGTFQNKLAENHQGDLCSNYLALQEFLNKTFSKCSFDWHADSNAFIFQTKTPGQAI